MSNEIKETITRGQAMDIADTQKFNEDVNAVRIDGDKGNQRWSSNILDDAVKHNPKRQVDFSADLDFVTYLLMGYIHIGRSRLNKASCDRPKAWRGH